MILCAIADFPRWTGLHPRFLALARFLEEADLGSLPEGRSPIDGEHLFALVSRAAQARPEAPLEAHRTYIDVQVILAGVDLMGWAPLSACQEVSVPYDAGRDIAFFGDKPQSLVPVPGGHLAIFFPEDAHAPLIGEAATVHKLVFKVRAATA